jgi:hypothetical protein
MSPKTRSGSESRGAARSEPHVARSRDHERRAGARCRIHLFVKRETKDGVLKVVTIDGKKYSFDVGEEAGSGKGGNSKKAG